MQITVSRSFFFSPRPPLFTLNLISKRDRGGNLFGRESRSPAPSLGEVASFRILENRQTRSIR